jgi:hypothetical protein
MQVNGFFVFFESKELWDDMIKNFEAEGIDYKKNFKEDLDARTNDLLAFLPASMHPAILDGTFGTEYPSEMLQKEIEQWQKEYKERNEVLRKTYYDSIKESLPHNVIQLVKNSLHDASVTSIEHLDNDIFVMDVDCRSTSHYHKDIKLIFIGVKECSFSEKWESLRWLYDEIYVTKEGFELHVLFNGPLSEMKIITEDVLIEEL